MVAIIPYISLGVSLLAIGVSYYCFKTTQRRSIRPVLIFSSYAKGESGVTSWHVENAGSGPAVNVLLAAGDTKRVWNEQTALLLPALPAGSKFHLNWIHHPGSLLATYADSEGRAYTSICVDNRNHIAATNRYPHMTPKIYSYQLPRD